VADENAADDVAPIAEIELIPDAAVVTRLIDAPRMYEPAKGLIWASTFEFPNGAGESVNWDKYAPLPDEVHRLGRQREAAKREVRSGYSYVGFIAAPAEAVRSVKTVRGHGFALEHAPSEGLHHAEIRRVVSDQNPLNKADKGELRLALERAFGSLVPYPLSER
jgi:hypothetical protein